MDGRSATDARATAHAPADSVGPWAAPASFLATAASAEFEAGSNRKGDVAGGNWTFLLSRLSLRRVLCLGAPSPRLRPTLHRVAHELVVADDPASIKPASVDLVVVRRKHVRRFLQDAALRVGVARVLAPDGYVYVEGAIRAGVRQAVLSLLRREFGALEPIWTVPATGDVHAAAPARDREAIEYLRSRKLDRAPTSGVRVARAAKKLARRTLLKGQRIDSGTLLLVGPELGALPRYVRELAARAGCPIDDQRWALAAPGSYSSKKVVFFLFNGQGATPSHVVKLTRDPRHNPRLENEHRALASLSATAFGTVATLPRPTFFGYPGGLAVLGQTGIDGLPFRERSRGTADCPTALAAVQWLLDLATATANRSAVHPVDVAAVLRQLLDRCADIYGLDDRRRDFLETQLSTVAGSQQPFPAVFQHGDPGTWNVVVGADGRVAFLDWEAAEPQGIPLWDLFYFLRSYMVLASLRRRRGPLHAITEQGLQVTPLSRLLAASAIDLCARIRLDPSLVEPLFHFCWLHRALKEATRLAPRQLHRGHYISLLRRCIDQRASPGLQLLFRGAVWDQPHAGPPHSPSHP